MSYLLGIDLGTTNCKALLCDTEGRVVSSAKRPTVTHYLDSGWALYRPDEIWQSIASAIRDAIKEITDPAEIKGVATASMGEAGVPLDERGRWLYPIIAWFDPRTQRESDWWINNFGSYTIYKITGLPVGPKFSINKLMWIKKNEPQVYKRMKKWLCMADFVSFMLSGEYATDYSLASRTMAFDLNKLTWSSKIFAWAGIDPEIMPIPYPSGTIVGKVIRRAARETGLVEGTPVVTGGHDHICGALAVGAIEEGLVMDSQGTAESVVTATSKLNLNKRVCDSFLTNGCHVVKGKYIMLGGLSASGAIVEWFKEQFGEEEKKKAKRLKMDVYNLLMEEAAKAKPGSSGIFLLPHFGGSGPPHYDPLSKGVFLGLRTFHSKRDLLRAIIEGLSYQLRSSLDTIEGLARIKINEVRVTGGASKNDFWMQMKADVTGRVVEIPEVIEATAQGAAILAGIGAGLYKNEEEAIRMTYRCGKRFEPNKDLTKQYEVYYRQIFKRIYPAVCELNRRIDWMIFH